MSYYAHTKGNNKADWELLCTHLREVRDLAGEFADRFQSGGFGALLGLWHDYGKYRPGFQAYLDDAVFRGRKRGGPETYHSMAGAAWLWHDGRSLVNKLLANAVAGHHAGLYNLDDLEAGKIAPEMFRECKLLPRHEVDLLKVVPGELPVWLSDPLQLEVWLRMLFSCLVDADSVATERFYGESPRERDSGVDWDEVIRRVESRLMVLGKRPSPMSGLRAELSEHVRRAFGVAGGVLTLTAPTGLGKTLASLLFAAGHARARGLERIIVVAPYTAVIDQTVAAYEEALGDLAGRIVLSHHSALDPLSNSYWSQRSSEDWNVPIVVTTAVQFFESLFSNRRRSLRRIHRLCRSVVLIDEPQLLPTHLWDVLQEMLGQLPLYGSTVVLVTATQPWTKMGTEIVSDNGSMVLRAGRRVKTVFPASLDEPTTWEEVVGMACQEKQSFTVVPTRLAARNIAMMIPGSYHLSTYMCAEHRRVKFNEIRKCLDSGKVCRLVGTSLIETGVDLDFPRLGIKYLAGLDSIAQAAGRVNRNGQSEGRLMVYVPPGVVPDTMRPAIDATKTVLKWRGGWEMLDILDPKIVAQYFRELQVILRTSRNKSELQVLRQKFAYADVAKKFKMIPEERVGVVVPYGDWERRLDGYLKNPCREAYRALQPYTVELVESEIVACGVEERGGIPVIPHPHLYHATYGLLVPN
jgi:CRISPR-associated endonuclease/helicase Cas3